MLNQTIWYHFCDLHGRNKNFPKQFIPYCLIQFLNFAIFTSLFHTGRVKSLTAWLFAGLFRIGTSIISDYLLELSCEARYFLAKFKCSWLNIALLTPCDQAKNPPFLVGKIMGFDDTFANDKI